MGLIAPAIAVVLLIVAIAVNKLWPLMFLHVAGGAAWTIIDLFLGLVLGPIIGRDVDPGAGRVHDPADAEDGADHAHRGDAHARRGLAARRSSSGTVLSSYPNHGWVVASFIVVGVMSVLALGLLEPANIAVLFELKKPRPDPR